MSESLDDAEFWLPSQFLTDDDILMDTNCNAKTKNGPDGFRFGFLSETEPTKPLFPYELHHRRGSFGVSSDLSSPVESLDASSETESDEEDFIAALTRRMAHSTLETGRRNTDLSVFGSETLKPLVLSGSPQSTLCALGGGCRCGQESSRESPNAHSRALAPPATWDLLHAAAGEVAKMSICQEDPGFYHNRGFFAPARKPSPVALHPRNTNPDAAFYHKQFQAAQFQQLRQQQLMKQQSAAMWGRNQNHHPMVQNGARNGDFLAGTKSNRTLGLSPSAWPPLQQTQQHQTQQNCSAMRAVFLGNNGGKRECAGTGVFLPRQIGANPPETRKKTACSTVLVPARVVQALNLNLDDMRVQSQIQPPLNGRFNPESDVTLRLRSDNVVSHQKRIVRPPPTAPMSHEIRLPQDWTY
ncbi:hypothetical protein UlMin_000377 [Ulmus minor]